MRYVVAGVLLVAGLGLGLGGSSLLMPVAAAADAPPDDGGCAAVPANIDLATLQLVKRQLAAMRWEHNCVSVVGPLGAEAVTQRANEESKTGWQLASVTVEGPQKTLLCLKRPRAPAAR